MFRCFQVPCSKHRPPEAEAGDLAQFVLRCCAEDAYYSTGPGGEDRCVYTITTTITILVLAFKE